MTEQEAEAAGYQHLVLQEAEVCCVCGEDVMEGWTHEDTGDLICLECMKED